MLVHDASGGSRSSEVAGDKRPRWAPDLSPERKGGSEDLWSVQEGPALAFGALINSADGVMDPVAAS